MSRPDVARLRDFAHQALEQGRLEEALKGFVELERLDPNPEWARRAAHVLLLLGRTKEQVHALIRAARGYAGHGEILKAAAVSKQILAIDPRNPETMKLIGQLRSARDAEQESSRRAIPVAPQYYDTGAVRTAQASQQRADSWASKGHGLDALRLNEVVPGAALAKGRGAASGGIFTIPLADEIPEDQPLHLSLTADLAGPSGQARPAHGAQERMGLDPHGNMVSGDSLRPKETDAERIEDDLIAAVEEEVRAAQKASDVLTNIPLFQDLSAKTFGDLLLHARLVELAKGQQLFKQGDAGDAFYVIAEGSVGVIDEGPPRRGLAKLKDGDFFGEIALVTDQPRTATIAALTDTKLIAIDRDVVRKLVVSDPQFLTILLRFLRDRLVDRLLSTNPLFTVLSERDRQALRLRFRFLEAEPNAVMLEQGQKCDGLLILLAGQAEVVRDHGGRIVKLAELKTGDLIGEMSLVTQSPPIASIRASTKCLLLELPTAAFLTIINGRPQAMAFVQQVIEQRTAQAKAILAGSAQYAEGRLRGL